MGEAPLGCFHHRQTLLVVNVVTTDGDMNSVLSSAGATTFLWNNTTLLDQHMVDNNKLPVVKQNTF